MISKSTWRLLKEGPLLKIRRCSVKSTLSRSNYLMTSHGGNKDDQRWRRSGQNIGLTSLAGLTGFAGLTCHKIFAEEQKEEEKSIFETTGARIEGLPDYR